MSPRFWIGTLFASLATAGALAAPGCAADRVSIGTDCAPGTPVECCPCPWPEACPDGAPPLPPQCLDGGADAAPDGPMSALCPQGSCTAPPSGWEPVQFTIGPAMSLPECPEEAPDLAFEGMPEPTTTPSCPTCSCDAPLSSCSLPSTWTVSADLCSGSGVKTNFNPPAGWDGSCAADDTIPAGILCNGVPCVRSITISQPLIQEGPCTPHSSEAPLPPLKFVPDGPFDTVGRACTHAPWPKCAAPSEVCIPAPSSGFASCVTHEGDLGCPEGWPDRHLLYGEVDDQRTCSDCSCAPPEGATCSVRVHVYSDAACTTEPLMADISSDLAAWCFPLMPGIALSGKAAEMLDFQPGTCLPTGGELVGDVILADAKTICCAGPPST